MSEARTIPQAGAGSSTAEATISSRQQESDHPSWNALALAYSLGGNSGEMVSFISVVSTEPV